MKVWVPLIIAGFLVFTASPGVAQFAARMPTLPSLPSDGEESVAGGTAHPDSFEEEGSTGLPKGFETEVKGSEATLQKNKYRISHPPIGERIGGKPGFRNLRRGRAPGDNSQEEEKGLQAGSTPSGAVPGSVRNSFGAAKNPYGILGPSATDKGLPTMEPFKSGDWTRKTRETR